MRPNASDLASIPAVEKLYSPRHIASPKIILRKAKASDSSELRRMRKPLVRLQHTASTASFPWHIIPAGWLSQPGKHASGVGILYSPPRHLPNPGFTPNKNIIKNNKLMA